MAYIIVSYESKLYIVGKASRVPPFFCVRLFVAILSQNFERQPREVKNSAIM